MLPPHIVPSQLNIFTPDGTAIIIVANIVQTVSGTLRPVANMWCIHTVKPSTPMAAPA